MVWCSWCWARLQTRDSAFTVIREVKACSADRSGCDLMGQWYQRVKSGVKLFVQRNVVGRDDWTEIVIRGAAYTGQRGARKTRQVKGKCEYSQQLVLDLFLRVHRVHSARHAESSSVEHGSLTPHRS